ncbi:MAG: tRNA 2-thiouridine(34) synthase MnmA [Patescibacteria group bacterium]
MTSKHKQINPHAKDFGVGVNTPLKRKVFVLMSGGVDSSVAAFLLKKQGYDVAGVYLKLWEEKKGSAGREIGDPCWVHEKRDAEKVAARLGIPFLTLDVTREYKKAVLSDFINEYKKQRTPNPDVLCNQKIKFGIALQKARKLGFDYIATGHYARIRNPSSPLPAGRHVPARGMVGLYAAKDKSKDQSYFLWKLTQKELSRTLFPIGGLLKSEVRAIAQKAGLHTWQKKDSQGICFLGKMNVPKFLKTQMRMKPGPIVDIHGRTRGEHDGLAQYTIGQRAKIGGTGPYYIAKKDIKRNTLIVAHESEERAIYHREFSASHVQWIAGVPPKLPIKAKGRTRYRATLVGMTLKRTPKGSMHIICAKPERALTPGQTVVFYQGSKVLGGGIIEKVLP